MIDDSIVRATRPARWCDCCARPARARVHVRITCPPIAHPCHMGVDMATYEELIAHRMSIDEICKHIGCDSLHYLSLERMMRAIGRREGYCNACFTGVYPISVEEIHAKAGFEKAIG